MKLEPQKARHPQLLYESKLYKILQGGVGIPHIRFVSCITHDKFTLYCFFVAHTDSYCIVLDRCISTRHFKLP